MKTHIKNIFRLPVLLAGFVLMLAGPVTAQTFTTLYAFTGYHPSSGLILSGNTLYGEDIGPAPQVGGGPSCVFALNTDGTGFTNLYAYDGGPSSGGVLILSGNTLYGTAVYGGSSGNGTVFAVNTDGTGFTNLHSFTGSNDGANPFAGLVLSGNTLYGTATYGGSSGNGTVFAVSTNGTRFTVLHSFTPMVYGTIDGLPVYTNSDGIWPDCTLTLSGNTLYGTASVGPNGSGTVFSIFIQPQLTMIPSGPYMIFAWPTNYTGFTLQSTTNLASSAVWTTNSPPPVVIGGQNIVINTTTTGKQQFYRLSQ